MTMTSFTEFSTYVVGAKKGVGLQLSYLLHALKYPYQHYQWDAPIPTEAADFIVLAPSIFAADDFSEAQRWLTQLAHTHSQSCIVLLSSLAVFPAEPYHEWQETDEHFDNTPLTQALLALEAQAQQFPNLIILRTGLPFSLQGHDFAAQLISQVRAQQNLTLNDCDAFCPTSMEDVAEVILAMLQQLNCVEDKQPLGGIYHCAGVESVSAFQFAQALLAEAARHEDLPAIQISATEEGGLLPSVWVPCGDNTRLFYQFGIRPKPWRQSLGRLFRQAKTNPA